MWICIYCIQKRKSQIINHKCGHFLNQGFPNSKQIAKGMIIIINGITAAIVQYSNPPSPSEEHPFIRVKWPPPVYSFPHSHQNSCLHTWQVMWFHPSFFSIVVWHFGQCFTLGFFWNFTRPLSLALFQFPLLCQGSWQLIQNENPHWQVALCFFPGFTPMTWTCFPQSSLGHQWREGLISISCWCLNALYCSCWSLSSKERTLSSGIIFQQSGQLLFKILDFIW